MKFNFIYMFFVDKKIESWFQPKQKRELLSTNLREHLPFAFLLPGYVHVHTHFLLQQSLTGCSPVCYSCPWSFWAPENVWVSCSSGQWREGRSPGWWRECPEQVSPSGLWLLTGGADPDWYCWNKPSPWIKEEDQKERQIWVKVKSITFINIHDYTYTSASSMRACW